jgi:hypothetical protein
MRLTRRETLAGGALSLLLTTRDAPAQPSRTAHTRGCFLSDLDVPSIYPEDVDTRLFITGNEPMIPRSGDKYFDIALA